MQAQDLALSRLSSGCRQAELVAVQRPDELVAGPTLSDNLGHAPSRATALVRSGHQPEMTGVGVRQQNGRAPPVAAFDGRRSSWRTIASIAVTVPSRLALRRQRGPYVSSGARGRRPRGTPGESSRSS